MHWAADHHLHPAGGGDPAPLTGPGGQGRPGVRASRHIPPGPAVDWRSQGTRGLLCRPLCRQVRGRLGG